MQYSTIVFGDPKFWYHFCLKFTRSTLRHYLWILLITPAKIIHFQCQTSRRAGKPPILPIIVCYSPPSFLVIKNYEINFYNDLHGCPLIPYLWRRLVTTATTVHLQGYTSPEQVNPIFCRFLSNSPPYVLVTGVLRSFFAKNLPDVRQDIINKVKRS